MQAGQEDSNCGSGARGDGNGHAAGEKGLHTGCLRKEGPALARAGRHAALLHPRPDPQVPTCAATMDVLLQDDLSQEHGRGDRQETDLAAETPPHWLI